MMCQCHFVSKDNISRCTDVLNFIKPQLWLSHIYSNMWYQSNKSARFLVICLKCFHFITCIRTQPMSLRYPCKLNFMSQRGKKNPDKNTLRKKIFISKHSYVIMTHELLWYLIDSKKKKRKNTFLEWWKNATFLCEIDPHFNTPSTGCAWDIIVWLESIVLRVMQTPISCSGRCRSVTILFPKWQSREEFSGINLQNASFCESSIDFFSCPT